MRCDSYKKDCTYLMWTLWWTWAYLNTYDTILLVWDLGSCYDWRFLKLKPGYLGYYCMRVWTLFKSSTLLASHTVLAEKGNTPCYCQVKVEVQFPYSLSLLWHSGGVGFSLFLGGGDIFGFLLLISPWLGGIRVPHDAFHMASNDTKGWGGFMTAG